MKDEPRVEQENRTPPVCTPPVYRYRPLNLIFLVCLAFLMCAWFGLARAGLMLRNAPLLSTLPPLELARPFLVGFRFDVATACYLLAPFAILIFLPFASLDRSPRMRRLFYWTFVSVMGVVSYLLLAEYEFFREFQVRYNQIAIDYLDHPATVGGMIWKGYPVVRYTLIWLAGMVILTLAVRWLMRRLFGTATTAIAPLSKRYVLAEALCVFIAVAGLVVGIRGGIQGTPLRWGDAFKSESDTVNQLSLNGIYTLGRTLSDNFIRTDMSAPWLGHMSITDARRITRDIVVSDSDVLVEPQQSTVARVSGQESRTLRLKAGVSRPNVVLVIMESFSAQFIAACGANEEFAPSFSAIAREGVLFDRCFSIGTHTHQGIFGSLLSFPNLPGYEAMMQSPLANQHFSSLPGILGDEGYSTLFLYNGNFAWDNMRGFFTKQGVDRFISGEDFADNVRRDAVWGVDDADLFHRANAEFQAASSKGPFMGIVLTLSNHAPWDLPDFPGQSVKDRGELNGPIKGITYADWSVGQFIAEARKLPYFENTLFVFVGDHGSRVVGEKLTAAGMLTHHVPLLFFGPGVLDTAPQVDHTVASQLNITPTIMGLLGLRRPHASWGRDLFTVEGKAENIAIFKGSSGDNAMAIVEGDRVLAIDEANKAVLYRYSLAGKPTAIPITGDTSADCDRLLQRLNAFLQCGITDLRAMRAGPPASSAIPSASAPAFDH